MEQREKRNQHVQPYSLNVNSPHSPKEVPKCESLCNKLILATHPYSLPGAESMFCHSGSSFFQQLHESGKKCQVKKKPCTL